MGTANLFSIEDLLRNYFEIDGKTWRQTLFLTCLAIAIPSLQIIGMSFRSHHPPAIEDNKKQTFEETKSNFIKLVYCSLAATEPQHHDELLKKWLVVKEINTNNYTEEERERFRTAFGSNAIPNDGAGAAEAGAAEAGTAEAGSAEARELQDSGGRDANIISIDTSIWIQQAFAKARKESTEGDVEAGDKYDVKDIQVFLDEKGFKKYQTPMMEIIDHHVKIIAVTSRLKQFNIQMTLSEETLLREKRLPFRRVVETLRTVDDTPRFPYALSYSVVRALKDKDKDKEKWIFAEHGLRLDPIILSEKPWPNLKDKVRSYLISFNIDVTMYWLKAWITLVFLKILFS